MEEDKLLTAKQAAEILNTHILTVRRLVKSGELRHVRIGAREYRIRTSTLMKFIADRESTGREEGKPDNTDESKPKEGGQ